MPTRMLNAGFLTGLSIIISANGVGQVPRATNVNQPPSLSYSSSQDQRNIEYGLAKDLYAALGAWIETPNAKLGEACDRIAATLTTTGTPSVEMWFLSAKVAEARGQIEKAMQLLEDIVDNHSQEKTPGFQAPAGVSASMWLGRLARENGKAEVAIEAFDHAAGALQDLPRLQFLVPLCNMYKGEVLAEFVGNAADARSAYSSAAETAIAVSANSPDSPDAFMAMWARWKLGELDPNATREACPERLTQWVQPMLVQLLSLNGIIASPRVDFYSGADNARTQWPKMFIKKALETGKGRIDRDALWLTLAQLEVGDKAYDDALTALAGIGEDSFFASFASEERKRIQGLAGKTTAIGAAASTAPPAPSAVAQGPVASAPPVAPPPSAEPATTPEEPPVTVPESEPVAEATPASESGYAWGLWYGLPAIAIVGLLLIALRVRKH